MKLHALTKSILLTSSLTLLAACGGSNNSNSNATTKTDTSTPAPSTQTAPIAKADSKIGQTGKPVSINVVANDTDKENNIEPTTVKLINSLGRETVVLNVPNEGQWIVETTGFVTFTPNKGFTTSPTPVSYVVSDKTGKQSNLASISVIYPPTSTPDQIIYPNKLTDKLLGMQWSLFKPEARYTQPPFNVSNDANIHFGDYYKKYRGKGIKIAVIDSGLDVNQEDLQGAITHTYDIETGGSDVSKTSKHGTSAVGIIAARANDKGIFGVASESDIIFIRFKREMSSQEMVKLFEKAEEFGADIINCSWGSGTDTKTGQVGVSDEVKAKIQDLAKNGRGGKGTIIVFASGNTNEDIAKLNLEANIPEVISVGSSNEQNIKATMSNHGKNLDILAPGGDYGFSLGVPTLAPMGLVEGNTAFAKGTSAAAPLVSGVVALMLEKNPNLTRVQIENLLKSTADKIGNEPYMDGRNNNYGHGKINVTKLLDAVPNQ